MTLAQYLRLARSHWLMIALVTGMSLIATVLGTLLQTPVYSATARMFVTINDGSNGDISTLTQGSTFTQQRVKSYADIINSPDVLEPVIQDLGLQTDPTELAKKISASSPLDTVLLDVTVEHEDPARARDIANAVASRFTQYVADLEVPSASSTSPVKITVTRPAVAATDPDSPKLALNLALGLLVGLGLGIGSAVLRDTLDHSIGTRHDPGEIVGAPVLASIVEEPGVPNDPLITRDAFSIRAEGFRTLRTNLRFLSVDTDVRSVVVTSSVPGEGKTTTAANLAVAIAQSGERVVLIDADLRRPTVGNVLMLPNGIGLTSVLLGDTPPREAVQRWRDDLDLWVLTSGPIPPNPSELIGSQAMAHIVESLVSQGFMVIVDSPPLLPVTDAAILSRVTAGALLVTRASTRVDQLTAATEALRTAGAQILGVLVNRVARSTNGYYGYSSSRSGPHGTYAPMHPASGTAASAPATTEVRLAASAPSAEELTLDQADAPKVPPATPTTVVSVVEETNQPAS